MAALGWLLNLDFAGGQDDIPDGSGPRPGKPSRRRYQYGYHYIVAVLPWMR